MKPLLSAVPALGAIIVPATLTGCTVHNHYYNSAGSASPGAIAAAADPPGHAALADRLAGVHTAIKVTAANLANTNTLGYKARRVSFVEGQAQPQITIDWTVGSPGITDRPLDLYIEGDGFFQVDIFAEHGGGTGYTRRGQFFVNADGDLVLGNADGPRLSDGINISGDVKGISISAGGEVHVINADNTMSAVGTIMLHTFYAPDGLEPLGDGLYVETDSSGPATQYEPGQGRSGRLVQGMIETSNVDLIEELAMHRDFADQYDVIAVEMRLPAYRRMVPLPTGPHTSMDNEFGILLSHDH